MWDLKTRRVVSELNKLEENGNGLLRVCTEAKKRKPLAVLKHHVRAVHTVAFVLERIGC